LSIVAAPVAGVAAFGTFRVNALDSPCDFLSCGCFETKNFRKAKTPGFKQSKV
jgi:hypothetical protein